MGQNERVAREATAALAQAIREAQGAVDMTAAELSRRSGVPYSSLRKIRGGSQSIDWEELTKIAKALGTTVSALSVRVEEILG